MSWASAKRKVAQLFDAPSYFQRPEIPQYVPDWGRLVFLDFETFYDADYTLGKMSTSEYVRDRRFKAQMLGLKIGRGKTRIIPASKIKAELAKINWATHSACIHNAQFDGFILSHHYNVHPSFIFDTLAMARGLFSNDIGAGLDEVSRYLGGKGKIEGSLEKTKGVLNWPKALYDETAIYCAGDVDEMAFVFEKMLPKMPNDEIHLIDMITRMFTSPVLKVDIPRVEKELERELELREKLMYAAVDPARYDVGGDLYDRSEWMKMLDKSERELEGVPRDMHIVKKVIGSSEKFANLLRDEGVEPPLKVADAWMKLNRDEREEKIDKKYTYAFAKDDTKFINLPNDIESWGFDLEKPDDIQAMAAKQTRLQALVDVRIAVKSTTNITRAERFLEAGRDGMALPVGYAYYRAHTGRLGGNNKMNMQNLQRGGELRLSILAPKGHMIAVQDSGQIEARVNGWLWGQEDLLDSFRAADNKTGKDAYCNFASRIYGRDITKADENERFVGKVCVLGLGYQMGAPKLQITLAKGALGGPPVFFPLEQCHFIVNTYRAANSKIKNGWEICKRIIEDMAAGREGSHGPINWEKDKIWLPNGMCLHYPDLQKSTDENGWDSWTYHSTMKGVPIRKKIYGGLLCENIVQALARIIVMWQMLQIGKRYRCVMTTHDEVAALTPIRSAATCSAYMLKCMRTAPDWCSDLPLNSEGKVAENYSK